MSPTMQRFRTGAPSLPFLTTVGRLWSLAKFCMACSGIFSAPVFSWRSFSRSKGLARVGQTRLQDAQVTQDPTMGGVPPATSSFISP